MHVLDVLQVADHRVPVGVPGEGGLHHLLVHLLAGVAGALHVLAEDRSGLGAGGGLVVGDVLEAIGLVLEDGGQRPGRSVEVVDGHVLAGERVGVQPEARHGLAVLLGGVLLGAAEHHVLEEEREYRAALLHFIAAAHAHQRVVGDQAGSVVLDEGDAQTVGQRVHLDRKWIRLPRVGGGRGGGRDQRGKKRKQQEIPPRAAHGSRHPPRIKETNASFQPQRGQSARRRKQSLRNHFFAWVWCQTPTVGAPPYAVMAR